MELTDLISLTASGIQIASFAEIRKAIIDKYKSVYGSDIDLTTGSADGIFINNLSLIINNILQVCASLYQNLNVNYATGIYLDNLCRLSNVTRKGATKSTATLKLTASPSLAAPVTIDNSWVFIDASAGEWKTGNQTYDISAGQSVMITVFSDVPGPISAPAGWIYSVLKPTAYYSQITVEQPEDAIEGGEQETDAHLRNRRNQSLGAGGVTVLQSLAGTLLDIAGIEDVKIHNNNSTEILVTKDGTNVPIHAVYVIVRQEEGVTIAESIIGTILRNKMTPGIPTTVSAADAANGMAKEYDIPNTLTDIIQDVQQTVYWKQCVAIHPAIKITIEPYPIFSTGEIDKIKAKLFNYLNNLPIGTDLTQTDLLVEIIRADPQWQGSATYKADASEIHFGETNANSFQNPDTYYNYTACTIATDPNDAMKYLITVS